jgi:cardiolipin synthase
LRSGLRRHGVLPRPAELRRLLRADDVRFTRGNHLELHADGGSALEAMLAAIGRAKRRVHLETYILRSDETGRRFFAALAERAKASVEVRVLYDAVGSRGLATAAVDALRAAGADVVAFNPLSRMYPRWAPRRRDHRKILVVDGEVAFTGGLNIGDEYAFGVSTGADERRRWTDAHVRITGPAVQMLEAVFLESWFRADGPDSPWPDLDVHVPAGAAGESVGVLADGPTYHRRRMRELLIEALAGASDHVRLATPYFVPGRKLLTALSAAAARGVHVDLMIAGFSDHPFVRWAAYAVIPELVERGVRVYEVRGSMMHAKMAVFDRSLTVLGTSNLDRQSLQHSYEVNLIVEGESFARRVGDLLAEQRAAALPVTETHLATRGLWARWRDRAARFLLIRI